MDRHAAKDDAARGVDAAHLIWNDDPAVDQIIDPRSPEFAKGVLETLAELLDTTAGALKRSIRTAARSAEGLNVEPFQGLVEVIQNADDLRATEVRFSLRATGTKQQLLIVHNGKPVLFQHVLGMVIPYFTSKTEDPDQRGRFGIGLKTLARIASATTVHSYPYHFAGDKVILNTAAPEPAIPGLYDPLVDTLIVLDMRETFDEASLRKWFEAWNVDGLIFLSSVRSFRWCHIDGSAESQKCVVPGPWKSFAHDAVDDGVTEIMYRLIQGGQRTWTVWRAQVDVPPNLHPAHKARSDKIDVSIACSTEQEAGHLHIGFRTRVPMTLPVSFDAPFDPSTAREELVENDWNNWLVGRCGVVLAAIGKGLLNDSPRESWRVVPLRSEFVGGEVGTWLRDRFDAELEACRKKLAEAASVKLRDAVVSLSLLAYEVPELGEFLTGADVELMAPGRVYFPAECRDPESRWRPALKDIGVSVALGTDALLAGFSSGIFRGRGPEWWVEAAFRLTEYPPGAALFGVPFWLTDRSEAVCCQQAGVSARKLVHLGRPSEFATHWSLLDRLHEAYDQSTSGTSALRWLKQNAAVTTAPTAADELEAFAQRWSDAPVEVDDLGLCAIRDHFGRVAETDAIELGPKIGAAILLDGVIYKRRKPAKQKVRPVDAYLPRSLDGENPNWAIAADKLPELQWVAARYEECLKTHSGRGKRRRGEDGIVSRGARRFLTLLGAESAPRVVRSVEAYQGPIRRMELNAADANVVPEDFKSPDLELVLDALEKASLKDRKLRSLALFRTLSKNWARLYAARAHVKAQYLARKHYYDKAPVSAHWVCRLREVPWLIVGKGERSLPSSAVIRSPETQALYPSTAFVAGVGMDDVDPDMAATLGIRTDVRVSDLVDHLRDIRDGNVEADNGTVAQIYRNLSRLCPKPAAWNSRVGDLSLQDLRKRFSEGRGLIQTLSGDWRSPQEVLRGQDIFHDRNRFAPGGQTCDGLWGALGVPLPTLDSCISFCRQLAGQAYKEDMIASLIDVYRHMETLLAAPEKRHRDRLRTLPLNCAGLWTTERPILFVEDAELRAQLQHGKPSLRFWSPPCETRDLPRLLSMVGLTSTAPVLTVLDDRNAASNLGDTLRARFERAVDHLSDELARNDPNTRNSLSLGWDWLRHLTLFVYDQAPNVGVVEKSIGPATNIRLHAHLDQEAQELHVSVEGLPQRAHGGRAIASLFPREVRRKIDVEWMAAWAAAKEAVAVGLKLASDEEKLAADQQLTDALNEAADRIAGAKKGKIRATPQVSRGSPAKMRMLKETVGFVSGATVTTGVSPRVDSGNSRGLVDTMPSPRDRSVPSQVPAPMAYSTTDLEQAGWEVLKQVLESADGAELADFRDRHRVGADGAFGWKQFVELKATGRSAPTSVEMTNAEFERAKERGIDFILALVSGLEVGQFGEVRLIFDPVNRASYKPTSGVRFYALNEAPSITVTFDMSEPGTTKDAVGASCDDGSNRKTESSG